MDTVDASGAPLHFAPADIMMDASGALAERMMDVSGAQLGFALGVATSGDRPVYRSRRPPRAASENHEGERENENENDTFSFMPTSWDTYMATSLKVGHIRFLTQPNTDIPMSITPWFMHDRTLSQWNDAMRKLEEMMLGNPLAAAITPPDFMERIHALFAANQRQRWLARWVLNRWRQRMWSRRTQCNVDLIDMEPVADRNAIFLTDTRHRQMYRFHRRDVYQNLLSNLTLADDYFPTPRPLTNPWTNAPLTLGQTIGLCQQMLMDFAKRGQCPPVIFAAFCAARYDVVRLRAEQTSLLSQLAIQNYFKDLTDNVRETVFETMIQLFADMGLRTSPIAIRRWLREMPVTSQHRAWVAFARDYTLYLNLHVQPRPHWTDEIVIQRDAARLLSQTQLPDPVSVRVRQLRSSVESIENAVADVRQLGVGMLGLPMLLGAMPLDASGGEMDMNTAVQLIQAALFRL